MLSNYSATGDLFYSVQGNYKWTLEIMGNNDSVDLDSKLRRIWFFPFSWVISIGPPIAFLVLASLPKALRNFKKEKLHALWAMLFLIMLVFFIYNSHKGVLLLQHRFTGTLVVLSLPFIALYFQELNRKKIRNAFIFGGLMVGLSFVYNMHHISPIPRLGDQNKAQISTLINEKIDDDSALIVDFVGWEYGYYYSLQSRLQPKNIVLIQGAKNAEMHIDEACQLMEKKKNGIVVLNHESEFRAQLLTKIDIKQLKLLKNNADFEVYSFTK